MFLHDFLTVELASEKVRDAVIAESTLLAASATTAYGRGELFRSRLTTTGSSALFAQTVAVKVGVPATEGDVVSVPMLWEAVDERNEAGLFPRFDASLEIAPLAPGITQLTFFGRYDPPSTLQGEGIDGRLLHRVAEHTIRAFLSEVARRIGAALVAVDR